MARTHGSYGKTIRNVLEMEVPKKSKPKQVPITFSKIISILDKFDKKIDQAIKFNQVC